MPLLKRTSKHHQPTQLAAAIALGVVVGLVPKANLLAVGLYAALLVLPIHTLLALMVSTLIACLAGYFDPLTHAFGGWLLRQQLLQPLWYFLDNTAVLPWLGLHNTVVLGSLVSGVGLAAPTYLMSLRLFEGMRWNANARRESEWQETIILAPQPTEPAIVPPPKFVDLPQSNALPVAARIGDAPAEEEQFEPAREVAAIINSWHVAHTTQENLQPRLMSGRGLPIAHALPSPSQSSADSIAQNPPSADSGFWTGSFTPPPRPWAGERSEIVDSLDLAHNASEVLAWVDDMLEECLSEDTSPVITPDAYQKGAAQAASTECAPTEPMRQDDTEAGSEEERWLMETTIEVVRWGDGAPLAKSPTVASTTAPIAQAPASSSTTPPVTQPSTEHRSARRAETSSTSHGLVLRTGDAGENQRSAADGVQQPGNELIAISLPIRRPVQAESQLLTADPSEPPRGECLGFLLGHLRQEREGRL